MRYAKFVELYDALSGTTKKLEKVTILAKFLPHLKDHEDWIYLLRGRVFPEYDVREFGVSTQLIIKAVAKAAGVASERIVEKYRKVGDLGEIALELLQKHKQKGLFNKELDVAHVFDNLRKLNEFEGKGTVDKKLSLVSELLISASGREALYIIRTLLSDLRVGVADALLIDAINEAFFSDEEMIDKVKHAYDMLTDFSAVLKMAFRGKKEFAHVSLVPGRAMNVMLAVKAEDIEDAFRICGRPAAFEYKYDGFRVVISFDGKEVKLFTRRLEDVTKQFPDIVDFIRRNVKAKTFILDSEVVGFDRHKKKYLPFEAISQRIKRKYDIKELIEKLPVEINVFDVLYLDGKNTLDLTFIERRKILEKIVREEKWKIVLSKQIVTDKAEEAEKFYKEALKMGEEGLMIKNLNVPYKSGRQVGYLAKLKPNVADLDLVIVGGEYGTGKRAGGLTSFIVACRSNGDFLPIGMVSSGLKEKEGEGTTYKEMDKLLQPLIIKETGNRVTVKPKIVVSVTYQNIQHSPTYSSGFAMRFPRITHYRPERGVKDIASLDDIKKEASREDNVRKKAMI